MALRNATKPADTAETTTGSFETPEADRADTGTDTTAEVQAPKAADAQSATRALTEASRTAVASPLRKMITVAETLKDVIDPQQLESMGFGVFPRITVGTDGFSIDKTKDLGDWIKVEVLSWNYVWLVTTGEQNDSEANKLIKTSRDGINLVGGEGLVTDYVAELKAKEYDRASCKQYVEIYCNLLASEEKGEVAPEAQVIHQISVSPQSVGKWGAYILESKVRRMKGIEDSAVVKIDCEKKVIGPNKFGIMIFSRG